jgi:transposase-like protein
MDTSEQTILSETPKREARRRRSIELKRPTVEEILETVASVARVARRHVVKANQVFYGPRSIAKDGSAMASPASSYSNSVRHILP